MVSAATLDAAYARCQRMAREHYENFPVASFLLPSAMRPHIAAIYAFARTADDFADEPGVPDADRLRQLDDWRQRLDRAAQPGIPKPPVDGPDEIFVALAHTIRECRLPTSLFHDLLSAFRQDVLQKRYSTWSDVLDYCRRSANPVGRLVLRVAGTIPRRSTRDRTRSARRFSSRTSGRISSATGTSAACTCLNRIARSAGATDEDLAARRMTPEWRQVMAEMVQRTRALFASGRAVCDGLGGRLRWELRLTWLGGSRILDRLERSGYDVFNHRPTLGIGDAPGLLWRAIRWNRQNWAR